MSRMDVGEKVCWCIVAVGAALWLFIKLGWMP